MPDLEIGRRGVQLFSQAQLQRIVEETVLPELDETHTIVGVGAVTDAGARAALVFRKKAAFGEWRLEAAFEHDWSSGSNTAGARVIFKL